ncbi:hypothetical protein [Enterobacter roggenkampii]|uniref:hypothetical protein n=1 Tax=Enterobacter roggenkampii TaxID=1812935 RepID=UPI002DB81BC4|nr:hypothetical protein [Enterobacter roggenkampii]MEB5890011.1 hypothetical protein [Enterobacter roggenkampii]
MFKNDKQKAGEKALERQSEIYEQEKYQASKQEKTYIGAYSYDSNPFLNNYLRAGKNTDYREGYFPADAKVAKDSHGRTQDFLGIVKRLPATGNVVLYRGGSGARGTSGMFFRSGKIKKDDILINTDFSSFTESQAIASEFAMVKDNEDGHFDDTSVIFKIVSHYSAKAIAPYSIRSGDPYFEAESLVSPGHAFKVRNIALNSSVKGGYVEVELEEVDRVKSDIRKGALASSITFPDNVYDLRTGEPIDVDILIERLGLDEVKELGLI